MATDALEIVGEIIAEKYKVESVVGEGGFAVVYRAMHEIWNRPVALKVFKALDEVPAEHRDRLLKEFVQEGALLAELSEKSAAIVQARDVGMLTTKRGVTIPYMVLEWLEGKTLEDILLEDRQQQKPARTLAQTMALLAPVGRALGLAHDRGIAHRDVKPANVFVLGDPYDPQPSVKLLDFGIAKVVQDVQKMAGSFTKTSGQITSFTPAYGAPEQFSRDYGATGPWTDVFAFALILCEVLTGKEPLGGDTLTQLAFASVDPGKRPTPRTLGAQIPDSVEGVFRRALAVKVDDRFKTLGEFWGALEAAVRGEDWELVSGRTVFATNEGRVITQQPGSARVASAVAAAPQASESKPSRTGLYVGIGGVVAAGLIAAVVLSKGSGKTEGTAPSATLAATPSGPASSVAAAPATPKCAEGTVLVPGGTFFMGSKEAPGVPPDETPPHPVKLSPYCIDKYEVTVDDYVACSKGKGCERADDAVNEWDGITPAQKKTYDPLCNLRDAAAKGKHPVNCISWEQAATYCKSFKKTLPTEAQWEFAARGLEQHRFPWGDDEKLEGRLNACGTECLEWGKKNDRQNFPGSMYGWDDQYVHTSPVGSFPKGASPFGVEDMSGNVFEWVQDVYAPYPVREKGVRQDELIDPPGPAAQKDSKRVVRGGGWNSIDLFWLRPTFRFNRPPWYRTHGIGFRCAALPGS